MSKQGPPGSLYNIMVPDRVRAEMDFALAVGFNKHGEEWHVPRNPLGPLDRHLEKRRYGNLIDETDGHRHSAAVAIRALQLLTKELKDDEAGKSK